MATVTGQRPGGLTVLGIENIILGSVGVLNALSSMAFVALLSSQGEMSREFRRSGITLEVLYVSIALNILQSGLLLPSGIGYLKQKRVLGKILGNGYGLLGLAGTVAFVLMTKQFNFFTLVGLIYPVQTLLLLNTTFREDFPNP